MSSISVTSLFLVASLVVLALLPSPTRAHFTLTGSREASAYPSDNRRFWPIAGGSVLRPVTDCLQLPKASKQTVAAGSSQTFRFEIGNFAKHVGMCSAVLINPATGSTTSLGSSADCVNKAEAMTVQIPPTATCSDCVVKISVVATHLGADRPETYDSCIDVDITGGSGGGRGQKDAPAPSPTATTPTPAAPASTGTSNGCTRPGSYICQGPSTYAVCTATGPVPLGVPSGFRCSPNGPHSIMLIAQA